VLDKQGGSWDLIRSRHVGIEVGSGYRIGRQRGYKEKKEKPITMLGDERRCEEVAQLLEGKKGDELAATVRTLP
jgi:hypothetical protein